MEFARTLFGLVIVVVVVVVVVVVDEVEGLPITPDPLARINYYGWKVLRVRVGEAGEGATPGTPKIDLNELDDTFSVNVLGHNKRIGEAEVAVSPSALERITSYLHDLQIPFTMDSEDLGRQIFKTIPNLRAESDLQGALTLSRYMIYEEITAYVESLQAKHPDRVWVDVVGRSVEGRVIHLITITDGVNTALANTKPVVFIDGGFHAREWISIATALGLVDSLINNPTSTRGVEWKIMPLVNPDGYVYSWEKNRLWRKNKANSSHRCSGVDLNRNFGYHWGESGSSDSECSQIYKGPLPFSEPESRAVQGAVLTDQERTMAYISFHSYGQMILHPYGYSSKAYAGNKDELARIGAGMAKVIQKQQQAIYHVGQSSGILYAASGASDDWAKGVAKIPLAYTIELRDTGNNGFLLPGSLIKPTVTDAWLAMKYLGEEVERGAPTGHVRPSLRQPGLEGTEADFQTLKQGHEPDGGNEGLVSGVKGLAVKQEGSQAVNGQQGDSQAVNLQQEGSQAVNLQQGDSQAVNLQQEDSQAVNGQQGDSQAVNLQQEGSQAVNLQQEGSQAVNGQQGHGQAVNLQQEGCQAVNLQQGDSDAASLQQGDSQAVNLQQEGSQAVNLQQEGSQAVNLQQGDSQAVNLQQVDSQAVNLQQEESQAVNGQQGHSQAVNLQQGHGQAVNLQQEGSQAVNLQQGDSQAVNLQQVDSQAVNLQQEGSQAVNLQQGHSQAVNLQQDSQAVNRQQEETELRVPSKQDNQAVSRYQEESPVVNIYPAEHPVIAVNRKQEAVSDQQILRANQQESAESEQEESGESNQQILRFNQQGSAESNQQIFRANQQGSAESSEEDDFSQETFRIDDLYSAQGDNSPLLYMSEIYDSEPYYEAPRSSETQGRFELTPEGGVQVRILRGGDGG